MDEAQQAKKIRKYGLLFLIASIVVILCRTDLGSPYHILPQPVKIALALLWAAWGVFGIIASMNCLKRGQGYLKTMFIFVCVTILMLSMTAVLNSIELQRPENNPSFIAQLHGKYESLGADFRRNMTEQQYVELYGNRILGLAQKVLFVVEVGVIVYLIYILVFLKNAKE